MEGNVGAVRVATYGRGGDLRERSIQTQQAKHKWEEVK
jgi:hypothetical protein